MGVEWQHKYDDTGNSYVMSEKTGKFWNDIKKKMGRVEHNG